MFKLAKIKRMCSDLKNALKDAKADKEEGRDNKKILDEFIKRVERALK